MVFDAVFEKSKITPGLSTKKCIGLWKYRFLK
jgi:hypothetical protein